MADTISVSCNNSCTGACINTCTNLCMNDCNGLCTDTSTKGVFGKDDDTAGWGTDDPGENDEDSPW